MKKLLAGTVLSVLFAFPMNAQEVSYALPYTSIKVEVTAVKTSHFAGPYSAYAKELLNMDVPQVDRSRTEVTDIRVSTALEADPWAPRLSCPAGAKELLQLSSQGLVSCGDPLVGSTASWRFTPQIQANFGSKGLMGPKKNIKYPADHAVSRARTEKEKAQAAADIILDARTGRLNIATGNTDASYSGESLAAALGELSRVEEEYLVLFAGYSEQHSFNACFEVLPSSESVSRKYTAFVLTEEGDLVKSGAGVPYEVELTVISIPEPSPAKEEDPGAKRKPVLGTIHYRVPAICNLRFLENGECVFESRIPVYQLGRELEMPITQ